MGVNVDFNCVGCGRCCVGGTKLSFDEMVKLAGVFPIGTSFHSLPGKSYFHPKQYRHLKDFCLAFQTENREIGRVLPGIATMTPKGEPCPARSDDMRCSRHGVDKPANCSASPLSFTIPSDLPWTETPRFLASCPPEALRGPPLLRNGRSVDPAYRQTLADMKRAAVRDFALMKRTLELQIDLKINEGLGAHLAVQSTIGWRYEDIGHDRLSVTEGLACLLLAAVQLERLGVHQAIDVATAQMDVCGRYLEIWRRHSHAVEMMSAQVMRLRLLLDHLTAGA